MSVINVGIAGVTVINLNAARLVVPSSMLTLLGPWSGIAASGAQSVPNRFSGVLKLQT